MFNNETLLKFIARRVFPGVGKFSPDGVAQLGLWDVTLKTCGNVGWLTVSRGRDSLFQVEVEGTRVKARYALPTVVQLSSHELGYGTAWAKERMWHVEGWVDADLAALFIGEFFRNFDEFIKEEDRVYKIINSYHPGV